MSVLSALAKAEAVRSGRAQPTAAVRHVHLADRPLVAVPLRLAGEAAAPLAIMIGTTAGDQNVLVVPQPRDRVLRLRFVEQLADVLLPYVASFLAEAEELTSKSGETYTRCLDAPQLWTPNPGGVNFLKLLGRSVRFHRTEGDNAVPESIPLLGRWLTWFGDRAEHPGSAVLPAMTTVLAQHWASGQSALEDGNLAALLGWIDPPRGYTGAEAAAIAEDPLQTPPAGPATDPGFDNEELAPLITAYNTAADENARSVAAERLERSLRGQLEPTWRLMWRALELLRALPEGASVENRWTDDRGAFSYFAAEVAEGVPQARRDPAVRAVRKLLERERALEALQAQCAFDDPLLMLEHRVTGAAFRGTVIHSEPDRIDRSGARPKLRPHIHIRTSDPFTATLGEELTCVERPKQSGVVVEIEGDTLVLELSGGMGRKLVAEPGSVPAAEEVLGFARFKPSPFNGQLNLPAREDTPWTHGGPPPEWTPPTDDEGEELE
ncbi:hypothetical protein NN3_53020 [Nocardia neocaledoniensis NBRC 108232]|uniref:Uncharacterized protein n=1 Tax=Nocardia neocaledoniensis TaxID=236511 RepID=A0A317N4F0_9NOCA|nr:hypothetical protein [Nocardia neocaledoniensis]PWV70161.1 hypothetical protein DFR69_114128 [Nocardia neocaledoniensis]GEM34295.1 hypothetical protein NN3_53020 [Nocardia neocaledoniensis NBRC 108232]